MTPTQKLDAEAELARAEDSLRAAQALLDLGIASEAAGRIYYAVFHAARALLFSEGIAPKSHEAVRALISLHFVKAGRLPPECTKDLAQLEGLRNSGDYDTHFTLGAEQLEPELKRARRFLDDARAAMPVD